MTTFIRKSLTDMGSDKMVSTLNNIDASEEIARIERLVNELPIPHQRKNWELTKTSPFFTGETMSFPNGKFSKGQFGTLETSRGTREVVAISFTGMAGLVPTLMDVFKDGCHGELPLGEWDDRFKSLAKEMVKFHKEFDIPESMLDMYITIYVTFHYVDGCTTWVPVAGTHEFWDGEGKTFISGSGVAAFKPIAELATSPEFNLDTLFTIETELSAEEAVKYAAEFDPFTSTEYAPLVI